MNTLTSVKKFQFQFQCRAACPFMVNTKQAKEWNEKKIVLVILTGDNRVFMRDKDTNSYRAKTKWREKTFSSLEQRLGNSPEKWLEHVKAVEAFFRTPAFVSKL